MWTEPWRHVRKDGSIRLVRVSTHPLDFAGRPARLVTVQDVTEITRTADALRESREHYRFFIGRTAEGVWRAAVEPPRCRWMRPRRSRSTTACGTPGWSR